MYRCSCVVHLLIHHSALVASALRLAIFVYDTRLDAGQIKTVKVDGQRELRPLQSLEHTDEIASHSHDRYLLVNARRRVGSPWVQPSNPGPFVQIAVRSIICGKHP